MHLLKIKYLDKTKSVLKPRTEDVGIDLYSTKDIEIPWMETALIPTGISVEVPPEYWLNLRDRSSMSKYYHVLAGVVDSGFRGQIMIRLLCHSKNAPTIKRGDKVAQMLICRNYNSDFYIEISENLSETERGGSGFGSTGR